MKPTYLFVFVILFLVEATAQAQHLDVLAQDVDGKVGIGTADYDNDIWTIGQRVFRDQLLSNFRSPNPGFTALENGNSDLEPGVFALPGSTDLLIDIVPTTIGGQSANFWYWDGVDTGTPGFTTSDVMFGATPPNVSWNLLDANGVVFKADGSDTVVPNALVQQTFADGGAHKHLLIQIDDGDNNPSTFNAPQGVYLAAFVLHIAGLDASDPFFFVHRTSGLANDPRDVAAQWVDDNYDLLVGAPVPGDFDADGFVGLSDLNILGANFGSMSGTLATGDATGDGNVDLADLNVLGANWNPAAAVAVPEPSTALLVALGACAIGIRSRK